MPRNPLHNIRARIAALLAAVVLMAAWTPCASAQEAPYKFDFGAELGMSGYQGEASKTLLSHPGFAFGLGVRYLPTTRWAFRGGFNVLTISGDTSDMDNVWPEGKTYSFNSTVYDLTARVEFNFFSFGIGETYKKMRRWTPYLSIGLGLTMAMCDDDTAFGPSIPMGFGFKFKLKERLNLFTEFAVIKVFNDHIDGKDLSDLATIKSSFLKNNDWYSRFTVGISYEFGKRCETCHYVD